MTLLHTARLAFLVVLILVVLLFLYAARDGA